MTGETDIRLNISPQKGPNNLKTVKKTNQDILQAMFEVTGHLGLYGAQIKVTLQCHSNDGKITSYFSDIKPPFSNLSFLTKNVD